MVSVERAAAWREARWVARRAARPTARIPVDWSKGLASTAVDSTMTQSDVTDFDNPRCMLTKLENSHNQPFVIYLTGDDKKSRQIQQNMKGTFNDDRIGVAAQVICMIEGDGTKIDESHPFHRHVPGDTLPRMAVFAGDGTKIGQIDGSATASQLFELMNEAFDVSYDADFSKTLKAYQKLLTGIETLRDKKSLIDDKYLTAETRQEEKSLEKKIAKLEKEADKLRDKKERLLDLKRRWGT